MTGRQVPDDVAPLEPADTARRLAEQLLGRRWPTYAHGLIEVTQVEVLAARWPIRLRLTVENDDWTGPRLFELCHAEQHTIRGVHPATNAEAMTEDSLDLT